MRLLKNEKQIFSLRFDADVADTADQVIGRRFAIFHSHHLDGISLIVGPENEVSTGSFHVLYRTCAIFEDGVHVELSFAVGLERVVVTVDQEGSAREESRVHAHAFAAIYFNDYETFPLFALGAFGFRFQLLEKRLLEFQDFLDVHAGDERLGGGDGSIGEKDVLKFIVAGRQDGSALVNFRRVEKIQHGKMLNGEDPIHALEAEAALAIQEVGDVSLFKSRLLRQAEAGQFAFLYALPNRVTEIILQHPEFHSWEYTTRGIAIR